MKKIFTLILSVGMISMAAAQSTTGWKSLFAEDFANNRNGWSTNESSVNISRLNFEQKVLVLIVNDNGDRRSTGYTRLDFNEDFIIKSTMSMREEGNGSREGQIGLIFGYSSHKYAGEQGWYAVYLNYQEDKILIRSNNENGTRLYETELTSVRYDNDGNIVVGVKKEGDKVAFFINDQQVYENIATTTAGGAITFIAKDKMRGLIWDVNVYEKDIPPTPQEEAEAKALDEAVSQDEEKVIVEAVSNLEFASGKSTISPNSLPALNTMAEMMVRNTNFKVILKGHTDDVGDPAANVKLSQDRVDSVINYLIGRGIDPGRLTGLGYGDKVPIADNDTPEGRQKNRRVEFEIVL
jgi:outer membrane protein OmpA-like peptidoglycan-associated protein